MNAFLEYAPLMKVWTGAGHAVVYHRWPPIREGGPDVTSGKEMTLTYKRPRAAERLL